MVHDIYKAPNIPYGEQIVAVASKAEMKPIEVVLNKLYGQLVEEKWRAKGRNMVWILYKGMEEVKKEERNQPTNNA